jgi:hypothetical protein
VIAHPTVPQLLQTIKSELTDKIAPALSDPTHLVTIDMITALLDALSVRTENEVEWMRNESTAIEDAAAAFVARLGSGDDRVDRVAEALDDLRANAPSTLTLGDVRADYDRAGEVLSRLADAAYAMSDAAGVADVERLVQQRLDTEMAIVGSFVAVGRE